MEPVLPPKDPRPLLPLDFDLDEPTQQLSEETLRAQALEALVDETFDFATTRSEPPVPS